MREKEKMEKQNSKIEVLEKANLGDETRCEWASISRNISSLWVLESVKICK